MTENSALLLSFLLHSLLLSTPFLPCVLLSPPSLSLLPLTCINGPCSHTEETSTTFLKPTIYFYPSLPRHPVFLPSQPPFPPVLPFSYLCFLLLFFLCSLLVSHIISRVYPISIYSFFIPLCSRPLFVPLPLHRLLKFLSVPLC